MSAQYEVGGVYMATVLGVPDVRVFRVDHSSRPWITSACEHRRDDSVTDVRPLVVLDPLAFMDVAGSVWMSVATMPPESHRRADLEKLADQIAAQTRPMRWEVFEHLVVSRDADPSSPGQINLRSVCGKVWKLSKPDAVKVVGKCPECLAPSQGEWLA